MRRTLYFNDTGNNVNQALPGLKRMVAFEFDEPVTLLGLALDSTVVCPNTTGPVAIVAAIVAGDNLSINSEEAALAHLFRQMTTAVAVDSKGKNSSLIYGAGGGDKVRRGGSVAIYAASPNDAAILLTAALTIHYEPQR